MKQLLSKTIWASNAIPVEEWKYRNLKRFLFPSFDFFMTLAGVGGLIGGISTLDFFWDPIAVRTYEIVMILSALFCFFGNIFPSRWRLEIAGVTSMMGLSVVYMLALVYRTVAVDQTRIFGFFYVAAVLSVILFRLNFLGSTWQDRRRAVHP